jgi:broad specificity phosphatase PhoE
VIVHRVIVHRSCAFVITHPDVVIEPAIPVPDWPLSPRGLARMRGALAQPWMRVIAAIYASRERKARDAAAVLAEGLGLPFTTLDALGENDRSATGYLPRMEFETVADAFFARPESSVRGWERAVDAQRRILAAFDAVLAAALPAGDIAIVTHGAVAALLCCALEGLPISRDQDQPPGNGGFYYAVDRATRLPRHGWRPIDVG